MPVATIGFLLKPAGFFSVNPALDVPPSAKQSAAPGACCH
jgi:primary-amine oxidase